MIATGDVHASSPTPAPGVNKGKVAAEICCLTCIAAFDFVGEALEGQLSFAVGDQLEILRWSKAGWWWGRSLVSPDRAGWMPSAFLQPFSAADPVVKASIDALACEDPLASGISEGQPPLPPAPQLAAAQEAFPFLPAVAATAAAEAALPTWPPVAPGILEHQFAPEDQLPLPPGPPPVAAKKKEPPPTWPALPPLGLAGNFQPPLPAGRPPTTEHGCNAAIELQNFDSNMSFLKDGRVGGSAHDDRNRQVRHYFDYDAWAEGQSKRAADGCRKDGREPPQKPTGDGGFKRKRF